MLSTIAFSGGFRYSPTTSVTLATSSGSVENLNVSTRHGCTRWCRQVRSTVEASTPKRSANSRDDQCVTPSPAGGGVSVAAKILARSTVRGRPERRSSSSPCTPELAYRFRQPITEGRETPTRSAISVLDTPSAASSTIRARCASPALIELDRVQDSNTSRSPGRRPSGCARTPHSHALPLSNYFRRAALGTKSLRMLRRVLVVLAAPDA